MNLSATLKTLLAVALFGGANLVLTPTEALLGVGLFGGADLALGYLRAQQTGTTDIQKGSSWLQSTVLTHIAPTVLLWLPSLQAATTSSGQLSAHAFSVLVFAAAATAVPKLAQDCATKLLGLAGQPSSAAPGA